MNKITLEKDKPFHQMEDFKNGQLDKEFLLGWELEEYPELSDNVFYRYMSCNSILKTCEDDAIYLRLSHVNNFNDNTEGSIIEEFYHCALEELKNDELIKTCDFERFVSIRVPEMILMADETGAITNYKDRPYETYVYCFSREKEDKYMYENFANKNGKGGCLELSNIGPEELNFGRDNNIEIHFVPVLYGATCIPVLKENIMKVVNRGVSIPEEYIKDLLSKYRYCIKKEDYSEEKEVRMVAHVNSETYKDGGCFFRKTESGKEYLYARIGKDYLTDITFDEKDGEREKVIEVIKARGYILI